MSEHPMDAAGREGGGRDGGGGEEPTEEIPLGQRIFDSPFLLLVAGIAVMFVFFTGWGLWELAMLSDAPLP